MSHDDAEFGRELGAVLDAALKAADAGAAVRPHLPPRPTGRLLVVGAGKAAGAMAAAVEAAWDGPLEGVLVVQRDYGRPVQRLRLIEATHPLPGLEAQAGAAEALLRAAMLGPDDMMLVLLSGGGSALWPAPPLGLPMEAKRGLTRALLRSGAPIAEINAVRKHLSRIKGGKLARAAGPCPILALSISDVPGDDPAIIASGPVSPDPTTLEDARAILARRAVEAPPEILAALRDPANETPKPGDPCFARVDYRIVLRPAHALAAAAETAARLGYEPIMLGDAVEGEAREVAAEHARLARAMKAAGRRVALISGGELTVTMRGDGEGGPSREYALGLALALAGEPGVAGLAADTDGLDGSPGAAGAIALPSTLARAAALGLDGAAALAANASGLFFRELRNEIVTGPTATNVNDVRVILVQP